MQHAHNATKLGYAACSSCYFTTLSSVGTAQVQLVGMRAAGASLGPEAALLALCGAAVSFTGKHILGFKGHNLRNCALLGMTAGLAAFFGVALGGTLRQTLHGNA